MNKKNMAIFTGILFGSVVLIATIPLMQNNKETEVVENTTQTSNIKLDFKDKTSEEMRDYYTLEGQEFIKKIFPDSYSSDLALLNVGKSLDKELKDIKFTTVNNREIKLKDLKGKKIVLDFAMTNCGVCTSEANFISNYDFEDSGIEFLHVFPRDNTSDIKNFFKSGDGKFSEEHIVSSTGLNGFEFDDLNITNVPAKIFIDENGIIQYAYVGAVQDKETLELHLKKAFDKSVPKMLDYLK